MMFPEDLEERLAALSPAKRALFDQQRREGSSDGHTLLARTLQAMGITHVYGVPGVPIYETVGACARHGLRVIGNRNQQASALMAAAQNYFAGRQTAAVLVSAGAAASNALTGVLVAHDNCWPLVVLVGAVPRRMRGVGQFMDLDASGLYRPITKWAAAVETTADIPSAVVNACEMAMRGRPGPVLLELPDDVLCGRADSPIVPSPTPVDPGEISPNLLDEAARRLMAATRPLLVIGKGTRWADPFADLLALVDRLSIPFVTSPIARGYLPDNHARCFNAILWAAQREANLVLLVGARLDWTFRYGAQIAADADLIQVDIHAPELGRNRPSQLAIHGDARSFLRGLRERLRIDANGAAMGSADYAWIESLRRRRDQAIRAGMNEGRSSNGLISPQELARNIDAALPADALCILDGNLVMVACQRHISANAPLSRLTPGSSGCMGSGIPFAIGAKMQFPSRPVVVICGDFAFGLSAFEMETAIRHNTPIVVVVANNDGNAGALQQRAMFPNGHSERVAMFQPGVRYEKIVEAFGGHGEHVRDAAEIGPALRRALACGKPACINVPIDPDAPFPRN